MKNRGVDKRGVSGVIFTIIMVVLVLAALVIVWGVIQNIISESEEDIALEEFTLDVDVKNFRVSKQGKIQPRTTFCS